MDRQSVQRRAAVRHHVHLDSNGNPAGHHSTARAHHATNTSVHWFHLPVRSHAAHRLEHQQDLSIRACLRSRFVRRRMLPGWRRVQPVDRPLRWRSEPVRIHVVRIDGGVVLHDALLAVHTRTAGLPAGAENPHSISQSRAVAIDNHRTARTGHAPRVLHAEVESDYETHCQADAVAHHRLLLRLRRVREFLPVQIR